MWGQTRGWLGCSAGRSTRAAAWAWGCHVHVCACACWGAPAPGAGCCWGAMLWKRAVLPACRALSPAHSLRCPTPPAGRLHGGCVGRAGSWPGAALAPGAALRPCEVDALWQLCQAEAGLLKRLSGGACSLLSAEEVACLEWLEDLRLYESQVGLGSRCWARTGQAGWAWLGVEGPVAEGAGPAGNGSVSEACLWRPRTSLRPPPLLGHCALRGAGSAGGACGPAPAQRGAAAGGVAEGAAGGWAPEAGAGAGAAWCSPPGWMHSGKRLPAAWATAEMQRAGLDPALASGICRASTAGRLVVEEQASIKSGGGSYLHYLLSNWGGCFRSGCRRAAAVPLPLDRHACRWRQVGSAATGGRPA
jgi:hypothetical protein